MEPKKISFGFSKTNKQNVFVNKLLPKNETKVELIKCVEGQTIKLVEEKPKEAPLIIPLKGSQKTSSALASLFKRRAVLLGEDETPTAGESANDKLETNGKALALQIEAEDLEKRAARELLAEVKEFTEEKSNNSASLVLPVVNADDLPLDGAKEPTFDDYESIPIDQFGLAMLRGMGWKEKLKDKNSPVDSGPTLRPKGMGLGADKALIHQPLLVQPESNEILEIKKLTYVRILGGKNKNMYGQIEGLDDYAGRVNVKMALGGTKESFNEFMCQPVSKKEYMQYSKCINSAKYDEYKKLENEHGQIILKKEDKTPETIVKHEHAEKVKTSDIENRRRCDSKSDNQKIKEENTYKDNQSNQTQDRSRLNKDAKSEERRKSNTHYYSDDSSEPNDHSSIRYQHRSSIMCEDYKSSTSRYNDGRSGGKSSSTSTSRIQPKEDKTKQRSRERKHESAASSDSDSDSDSKSHHKSHNKKSSKSKKSKSKSKHKHRERYYSPASSEDERHKSHKKKTKKSKRQRSRSRSIGRRR